MKFTLSFPADIGVSSGQLKRLNEDVIDLNPKTAGGGVENSIFGFLK